MPTNNESDSDSDCVSDNASTLGTNTATLKDNPISADNPMSASETLPKISEATKNSRNKDSLPSSVLETG